MDRVLVGVLLAWTAVAASGESKTLQKAPVPDATALEASQQAARDLFGDRFRSAKTVTAKTAVAAEMIEAALTGWISARLGRNRPPQNPGGRARTRVVATATSW